MTYADYKNYWLSKPAAQRITNPDGVYQYQCVDLILDYIQRNGYSIAGIYGNAIDYATKPTAAFKALMTAQNAANAQPGDIIVLSGINGNIYGHITLFDHATDATNYWPLEQNGATGNGQGTGLDVIGVWRTIPRSRIVAVWRPIWLQAAPKPPTSNGYTVITPVGAYYTAADAKAHANVRGTVQPNSYAIFNQSDGMLNVTTDPRAPGSWINPADNHAPTPPPVTAKTVTLPASSGAWHLYKEGSSYNPNDPAAVKGVLRPDLFGGLTYPIERLVSNNRGAVIKTQDFGEGVVWLAGTPAIVK